MLETRHINQKDDTSIGAAISKKVFHYFFKQLFKLGFVGSGLLPPGSRVEPLTAATLLEPLVF